MKKPIQITVDILWLIKKTKDFRIKTIGIKRDKEHL